MSSSSKSQAHALDDLVDYENDDVIELSPLDIINSANANAAAAAVAAAAAAAAAATHQLPTQQQQQQQQHLHQLQASHHAASAAAEMMASGGQAGDDHHGAAAFGDSSAGEAQLAAAAAAGGPKDGKGSYVGIHATNFRDFLLKPELQRAIADSGYEHPSEVQQEAICKAMFGNDILCQAKSGMGKTAVFVLSTLQQIDSSLPSEPNSSVRVLVLCHTRELAYQIKQEYRRFSTYMPGFGIEAVFGGSRLDDDVKRIKENSPKVLVATPGRMHALIRDNKISMRNVKHFVLDECDKLLESVDMRTDVQQIFKACPHQKQVMMFSATLNSDIKSICKRFMVNPIEIYVDSESKLTLHGLKQFYKTLTEAEKNKLLTKLLDDIDFNQCYIFVRTTRRADALSHLLEGLNFPAITVHSDLEQTERLRRYTDFKNMEKRIMVATDVMGRGIDVERVNLVINYDMSDTRDTYLHRVGRAGRFGTKGVAITFISSPKDISVINDVQMKFEVNVEELPEKIERALYMNNPEGAPTPAASATSPGVNGSNSVSSASVGTAGSKIISGATTGVLATNLSSHSSNNTLPETSLLTDSAAVTLGSSPRKHAAAVSSSSSSVNATSSSSSSGSASAAVNQKVISGPQSTAGNSGVITLK